MIFDLVSECQRLIQINSVSSNGTSDICNHLISLININKLDFKIELRTSNYLNAEQTNLILHKGPDKGEAVVWNCHLDTVDPGNLDLWTEAAPFSGTIKGDKIYGLGSSDTKLGIICMLKALNNYKGKDFKVPFYLVGTCCEEVGLYGIRELFKSPPFKPKYVVNTEPSEMRIVYAHKGLFAAEISIESDKIEKASGKSFSIEFKGVSAHSSTPLLGKNAVIMALEFLNQNPDVRVVKIEGGTVMNKVPEYCFIEIIGANEPIRSSGATITANGNANKRVHSTSQISALLDLYKEFLKTEDVLNKKPKDDRFDPPQTTTDLPFIRDNGDSVTLAWGFRRLPSTSVEETESRINAVVKSTSNRHKDLRISQDTVRSSSPFENSLNSELVKSSQIILKKLNLPTEAKTKAGSSEASIYAKAGADTIVIGPGRSIGVIHKPNEHNSITQLNQAVEFYKGIIERYLV